MCLAKCRLDGPRLNAFADKFYACYKDGLNGNGRKDMRSFGALYFVLRPTMFITSSILSQMSIADMDPYLSRSFILIAAALLVALSRPYKKIYMTVLDSLLLAHFGVVCHVISSYPGFYHKQVSFVVTFEIMLALPLAGFVLYLVCYALVLVSRKYNISLCPKRKTSTDRYSSLSQNRSVEDQPLIHPSTVREITCETIDYNYTA